MLTRLEPTTPSQKPCSKKEACEMLNIAYNTTRLQKIIDEYRKDLEFYETRKRQKRGKPASKDEISEAAEMKLQGYSVAEIAKALYRSPAFVSALITRVGVPEKPTKEQSVKTTLLPDSCCAESFAPGQLVWSARHHSVARVEQELNEDYLKNAKGMANINYEEKYEAKCYRIYVLQRVSDNDNFFPGIDMGGYSAYAPAYDLGSLEHLEKAGVNLSRLAG